MVKKLFVATILILGNKPLYAQFKSGFIIDKYRALYEGLLKIGTSDGEDVLYFKEHREGKKEKLTKNDIKSFHDRKR